MKGFPGICKKCKHRNTLTVQEPCWSCISNEDLSLHKPDEETEYAGFEAAGEPQNEAVGGE